MRALFKRSHSWMLDGFQICKHLAPSKVTDLDLIWSTILIIAFVQLGVKCLINYFCTWERGSSTLFVGVCMRNWTNVACRASGHSSLGKHHTRMSASLVHQTRWPCETLPQENVLYLPPREVLSTYCHHAFGHASVSPAFVGRACSYRGCPPPPHLACCTTVAGRTATGNTHRFRHRPCVSSPMLLIVLGLTHTSLLLSRA